MLHEQTFDKLHTLNLAGMAEAFKDQRTRPDMDGLTFEERFSMLVDAQYLYRENKRMKRLLSNAKLKLPASMEDIDYRTHRGLDKSVFLNLGTCECETSPERHPYRADRSRQDLSRLRSCPQGPQGRDDLVLHQDPEALLYARNCKSRRELRIWVLRP